MNNKILKSLLLVFVLAVTFISTHIHDDKCGYNLQTKTGCVYEIETYKDKSPGDA